MGIFDDLMPGGKNSPLRLTVQPDPIIPPPSPETTTIARGFTRGLKDPIDEGAALLTRGLEAVAPAGSWFEKYMQGQRELVDRLNAEGQAEYNATRGVEGVDVPRLAGNAVATAPVALAVPGAAAPTLTARTASGMVSGGLSGVLQPADPKKDYWKQKRDQFGVGVIGGGIAPTIAGAGARVVNPNVNPDVALLRAQGTNPTLGQTLGGAWNRIEEGLQSIPLVGDVVRGARTRANEGFNRTTINRALAPINQALPGNIPMGRQAVDYAHRTIDDAYNTLLPQLRVQADPQFAGNMQNLIQTAAGGLEPNYATVFHNNLRDRIFHRFTPNGGMTGRDFKTIESETGRLAREYSNSAIAGERELGRAFRQVQAEMRDLLVRSNPNHAQELSNINSAWANLIRVEVAAGKAGTKQGTFTPAQLAAAVRSADPSIRKNAYARGDAMMQDLSDAGQAVLGSKVPDSGTPFRSMVGLGTLGGGAYLEPSVGIPTALGAGTIAAAYSRPGQWLLGHLVATRPAAAAPVANALRRNPVTSPFMAALLASQANQ